MKTEGPSDTWSEMVDAPPITATQSGRLLSASIPANEISVTHFLRQSVGQPRFFWQLGGDSDYDAGLGTAVQLLAWGENRFAEIEGQAKALFERQIVQEPQATAIQPRLFGGFSFRVDLTLDNAWSAFHPAYFVLPHFQLQRRGDETWLTINAMLADTDDPAQSAEELQRALAARHALLREQAGTPADSPRAILNQVQYPMSRSAWRHFVNDARDAMEATALRKVVLARVCEIRAEQRIDVSNALEYLNDQYEGCTRFLFEPRPFHAFFGATPELLVSRQGSHVATMALAGSIPRGETAEADEANGKTLLSDTKERLEHQLVVESIRRRLAPLLTELEPAQAPEIYRLSYIQHLLTPIRGVLRQQRTILELVELLHPTPAMGGSPREIALDFIAEHEAVPRGWYASPIGWLDSQMNGEFAVAIRSAVAQDRRVWCYAGAGIVPDSQPDVEWQETDLKFQPMLRALNADGAQVPPR